VSDVSSRHPRDASEVRAHHPRAEASARLHGRYTVRVLEPSPPAISAPPFAADDPTARGSNNERAVVSPVVTGDLSWSRVVEARDDPELTAWCRDRWLADWRPLVAPASDWDRAVAEHRALAHEILGPWRAARAGGTGHRSLRMSFGGYGTPFCWDDQQLRMDGSHLILQRGAEAAGIVPDDLEEAALFTRAALATPMEAPVGSPPYRPSVVPAGEAPDPERDDRRRGPGRHDRLELDPRAAGAVADWIGFGVLAFERFRARIGARTRVQLDPDRFAVGLDLPAGRLRLPLSRPGIEVNGEVIAPGPMLSERDDHVTLVDRLLTARLGPG
jgi:hypothetical protein